MKINKIISFFAGLLILLALISCSLIPDTKSDEKVKNPVFRFTAPAARTFLPADPSLSQLTNYTLSYQIEDEDEVSPAEFSGLTYAQFQNISFELDKAYVNSYISFYLSAYYGTVMYQADRTVIINGGENTITLELKRFNLGHSNEKGSINIDIDFSGRPNAASVTKVALQLCDCYSKNPVTEEPVLVNVSNYTVTYEMTNVNRGSYLLDLVFYANNVPVLHMNPAVQVANNLTTYVTEDCEEFNNIRFNELYTVTFNPNAGGDTVIYAPTVKVSRLSKELLVDSPERDGYLFTGWFTDAAVTKPFYLPVYKNCTVYAGWQSLTSGTEGLYYATIETIADIVSGISLSPSGYGALQKPAVIKLLGSVLPADVAVIENALKTKAALYFELDFTDSLDFTEYSPSGKTENIVSIKFPPYIEGVYTANMYKYPSLRNLSVPEDNESFSSQDGVLYNKDKKTLLAYPGGKAESSFEIPEGVELIEAYSFSGSNLQSLIIPESVNNIEGTAFYYTDAITEFEVDEANNSYKAEEGLVYSKDGGTLCALPTSIQNLVLPAGVWKINSGVLSRASNALKSIASEANAVFLSFDNSCSFISTVLANGYPVTENDILGDGHTYYYIIDKDTAETVQVYNDVKSDVSDSSFTKINAASESMKTKYYKFASKPGQKYRLYWVDSCSVGNTNEITYTNYPQLADEFITVRDANFNYAQMSNNDQAECLIDDYPVIEFIAVTSTMYVAPGANAYGVCAFRIQELEYVGRVEPEIDVDIISDPSEEYQIRYNGEEVNGTLVIPHSSYGDTISIRFYIGDEASYSSWYLDGNYKGWMSVFNLDTSKYEPDVYTLTCIYNNRSVSVQIDIQ